VTPKNEKKVVAQARKREGNGRRLAHQNPGFQERRSKGRGDKGESW